MRREGVRVLGRRASHKATCWCRESGGQALVGGQEAALHLHPSFTRKNVKIDDPMLL